MNDMTKIDVPPAMQALIRGIVVDMAGCLPENAAPALTWGATVLWCAAVCNALKTSPDQLGQAVQAALDAPKAGDHG